MAMISVGRLFLDEAVLVGEGKEDLLLLLPAAERLLSRLRYSKLFVGICCHERIESTKVNFLKPLAATHSFQLVHQTSNFVEIISEDTSATRNSLKGSTVYVTARYDLSLFQKLWDNGWKVILMGAAKSLVENERLLFIRRLEEIPFSLCRFNRMESNNERALIVGYLMKQSREEDFLKRGAFPLCPTESGLVFVPLNMDDSLQYQIQVIDAVLHKATDEIIRIDSLGLDFSKGIIFSEGMKELERYVKDSPHCFMVDHLKNICPLVDRFRIQEILGGLDRIDSQTKCRIRAPRFLKVDDFRGVRLEENISESKLSFPCIVKPQAACGVPHAHHMALVFKIEDFVNLDVPLPAIVQEYVDHGSTIYKIYVLGERLFYAVKKSMPNASALSSQSEKDPGGPIIFDSLKSLPTKKDEILSGKESADQQPSLDLDLINSSAKWLREHLDLTIFGFDVVIQEGSGDHVVVDLNYLPSFKEIPDEEAIPAFWDAIKKSCQKRKSSQSNIPSPTAI